MLGPEKVTIKTTNVVSVLALTPVDPNLILTGKVLDKENGAVLYQKSIVDTPASDPSLTAAQFAQINGTAFSKTLGLMPLARPGKTG